MVSLDPESLNRRCGWGGKGDKFRGREALTAAIQVVSRSSTQRGSIPAPSNFVTAFTADYIQSILCLNLGEGEKYKI